MAVVRRYDQYLATRRRVEGGVLALIDDPHYILVRHRGISIRVNTCRTIVPTVDTIVIDRGKQYMAKSRVHSVVHQRTDKKNRKSGITDATLALNNHRANRRIGAYRG